MENLPNIDFIKILDEILEHRQVSISEFQNRWQQTIQTYNSRLTPQKFELFQYINQVVVDALTHMPGKKGSRGEIDWQKWESESDALEMVFAQAALQFEMNVEEFKELYKGIVNISGLKPPYVRNNVVKEKLLSYLKSKRKE